MENFEEKVCLCALGKIFGFKPKIALALIEHLGSAHDVFKVKRHELEMLLGPHSQYTDIIRKSIVYEAAEELERYAKLDISYTGWSEEHYPQILKECPDAPIGLYIRSKTHASELWQQKMISVVGTRDISSYGKEWCIKCIDALASCEAKPLIVSGLALGTDICAHKRAVEAGLPTIAVMATGPESIYPYRHKSFAEELYQIPGCALITDYPPGTAPLAIHFLRRNRIIAGLSAATILIESKIKGGGMMTARLAFSYDRDVFALPGRVDDIRSQGCNMLIRSKIAEPLISTPELLNSLGMHSVHQSRSVSNIDIIVSTYSSNTPADRLSQMAILLKTIRQKRDITIEELAEESGISYSRTVELTTRLETDGFIRTDLLQRCSINPTKR